MDIIIFEPGAISQLSTACLSLVSSATMAIMIARTEKGLTTPYRRIIFGMSISDVARSFGFLVGPFAIPYDVDNTWGIGNTGTCKADGFLLMIGMTAVPIYTCFLCFYYLCKLKYRMDNDTFAHRIEWKFHILIILYYLGTATIALAMDSFHPSFSRTACLLAPTPVGCKLYPEVVGECDNKIFPSAQIFATLNYFFIPCLCLFGMIGMMCMLCCHATALIRMSPPGPIPMRRLRSVQSADDSVMSPEMEESTEEGMISSSLSRDDDTYVLGQNSSVQLEVNRARQLSRLYKNETLLQGCLWIGVFCLTYMPVMITFGVRMFKKSFLPPNPILVLRFIFLPMGGLLNILVYSRPQAASLRRDYPSLSRLRCLWLVIKAGGEIPTAETNFVLSSSLPQIEQEPTSTVSAVQVGMTSIPPSELVISGLRSNRGTNTLSDLSLGTSTPSLPTTHTNAQHLESIQESTPSSQAGDRRDENKSPSGDIILSGNIEHPGNASSSTHD